MFDRDLAKLYGVETRRLNEQVKRNRERFPKKFMFQLTRGELDEWMSQIAISNKEKMGIRKMPYVFTEQGVAMLSAVLKSNIAVEVSVRIMSAFVEMRRFLLQNGQILERLGSLEQKQIIFENKTDEKFDKIFNALEQQEIIPKKGVFYDGQIFDAHLLVTRIIKSAKKSIILIDNYIDESVLVLFTNAKKTAAKTIFTRSISRKLQLDINKYNQQYSQITVKELKNVHDRFLIIDEHTIYHIGASIKDLGKKWFAFSKMDIGVIEFIDRIKSNI
jgi:hypothetical protein